ncbi:MAG: hypothetical protein JST04_06465 [Bdellovibrionales bacterium]|nr:hypothetical protein [Bdellovibrionales bacterium]
MIHPDLTRSLRDFAGTEFAQAAWSRTLPPEFSRARLLEELGGIRGRLPASALYDRFFGEPDFLATGSASRIGEWERSRSALVAAIRALEREGFSLATGGADLRLSFAHADQGADSAVLAIAVGGSTGGPGYGVDLERVGREISDAAFARFFRGEEGAVLGGADDARVVEQAPRLDHWVLKEACFKAHPRPGTTIVADYVAVRRTGGDAYLVECRKGAVVRFAACLGTIEGFRFGMAKEIAG